MTKVTTLLVGLMVGISAFAAEDEMAQWGAKAQARCTSGSEEIIFTNDVHWGLSFTDAAQLYEKLYSSKKRLDKHFYYSNEVGRFLAKNPIIQRDVNVPIQFVYSIKKHIEEALKREYAQWVFFPDMGHNHFFIPDRTYEKLSLLPRDQMIEAMMASSDLKMLYHTLEQIQVTDKESKKLYEDSWSQWRYYTRNIVGDNQGKGQIEVHKKLSGNYNTVGEAPGYRYWGAGVNVSANINGCFSYEHNGKTSYFDVSFFDLPYDSSAEQGTSEGSY